MRAWRTASRTRAAWPKVLCDTCRGGAGAWHAQEATRMLALEAAGCGDNAEGRCGGRGCGCGGRGQA